MQTEIERVIEQIHNGDKSQLDIIFPDEKKLLVEAPAGCGKTTTMVSKVAYLLASKVVEKNKKILALTFSVNAAYKMKKDIAEKLPQIGVEQVKSPSEINSVAFISNYHGLCRRILSLYGYLLDDSLRKINNFMSLSETDYKFEESLSSTDVVLEDYEKNFVKEFGIAVTDCDDEKVNLLLDDYNELLISKFITHECITFNGYLTLTQKLLSENTRLKSFFQTLFPVIVIDEFQDTNYLSWNLVKCLIGEDTRLFFMGDPLQRIYGFIGAVPGLMDIAETTFGMTKKKLEKNYRFKSNANMLALDKNIRANALNYQSPSIESMASISLHLSETHENESKWLAQQVESLIQNSDNCAILVQQRGVDIDMIMNALDERGIDYFYALFSDEDEAYIEYHRVVIGIIYEILNNSRYHRINKTLLNNVVGKIRIRYKSDTSMLITSLVKLTEKFFERVCTEYSFLGYDEKKVFVFDTFENRALKQNMDLIESKVFISTVHGAKGLEWNNVIIPDLEPYCFPNFPSLCGFCDFNTGRIQDRNSCKIRVDDHDEDKFLEELSVFYVATTRARKSLLFSASKTRYNNQGEKKASKISCLAFLPGITVNYI